MSILALYDNLRVCVSEAPPVSASVVLESIGAEPQGGWNCRYYTKAGETRDILSGSASFPQIALCS